MAIRLGEVTGIPVYHLDSLYWKPGWVETEPNKWIEIQRAICDENAWIVDGNYGGTMDIRLMASDTIIFLDINRYKCLYRAIMRSIRSYSKTRPDMALGCKEQFDVNFGKWIWEYPWTRKSKILEKLEKLSTDKSIIILKSDKDVKAFILECNGKSVQC